VRTQTDQETDVTEAQRRQRFDALFREQVAGVASYCRWRSRSLGDAEDAVAEVFLVAWRRLDDVPAGEAARPWLYATARRVLANQARASIRRSRLDERLGWEAVDFPPEDDGLSARVQGALAALAPRDREVLLLVAWEELSPAQIARVVRRPPVTVRVRLHRARRRFRAALEAQAVAAATRSPITTKLFEGAAHHGD
jgi:RNA polymerase sigma-70 factor (ECF subfamily)